MGDIKTFKAEEIMKVIKEARKCVKWENPIPEGWSKIKRDPSVFIQAFKNIWIKDKYYLAGFKNEIGGNRYSNIWALPNDYGLPNVEELKTNRGTLKSPFGALDNIMETIDGDRSHLSYIYASIFDKEIKEYGAMWHCVKWGLERLIDEDIVENLNFTSQNQYLKNGYIVSPINSENWKWIEEKPSNWDPKVNINKHTIEVIYYTTCGLHKERIIQYKDLFIKENYYFIESRDIIAEGKNGFVV